MLDVVLLRLSQFTPRTRSFADRLQQESGRQVACLVDERNGPVDVAPFPKVSLNDEALRKLKLHSPPDVGWRCGDYGLYLARQQFPSALHLWVIEYDVRISGPDLGAFFGFFDAHPEVDLIAPYYMRAASDWHWRHAIRSRNVPVYRCMFPLVRVSAPATDRLLERRQKMSRNWARRLYWANDEGVVATTLTRDEFVCRDMNDFGQAFYTNETFSFFGFRDGDSLDMESGRMAYHPVLFGEDYKRKLVTQQRPEIPSERFRRRLASLLNSSTSW